MRHLLLIALAAASLGFAGCQTCEYKSDFYWMSRLVPAHPVDFTTTGSGATYKTTSGPLAAAPAPTSMPAAH